MEVTPNILEVDDELQLTLPSGAKIGHRSVRLDIGLCSFLSSHKHSYLFITAVISYRALAKYYKQNLVSRTNPEGKAMVNKLRSHYLALGWTGATGELLIDTKQHCEASLDSLLCMSMGLQGHWQRRG